MKNPSHCVEQTSFPLPQSVWLLLTLACFFSYAHLSGQCPSPLTVTGPNTGTWTAPATGGPWLVQIYATGGGGGANTGDTGGSGATVSGYFVVQNGATLLAIAGGGGGNGTTQGGGGGGGSGVVNCGTSGLAGCPTGTLLLLAAGGNGAEGNNNGQGGLSEDGDGTGGTGNGGTGGGGGGGGLNAAGTNGTSGTGGGQVSLSGLSAGGAGNIGTNNGGQGMGGGGGSDVNNGSGGGGGHEGGNGGNSNTTTNQPQSFIHSSATTPTRTNGADSGGPTSGTVTISCIGFQPGGCGGGSVISLTAGTSAGATTSWTAPLTGGPFLVNITVQGGAGGGNSGGDLGGSGATMTGTFTVQNGEKLFAIAGGPGETPSNSNGGGGGGGSGVVNCTTSGNCAANGVVLIIAAGGNGAEGNNDGAGGSASTGGSGGGGTGSASTGGGGGGGGLNAPGGNGASGFGGSQVSLSTLSLGGSGNGAGVDDNDGGSGMGGGGGGGSGTNNGSGGGGGHTGANASNGGSASSFNSGTNPTNTNGTTGGGSGANASGTVTVLCLASLPVELINFKAVIQKNNTVKLLWATATEKENLGFDVERSADNRHWTTLGFVPGNGTTAVQHDYSYIDEKPFAGVNYYRLKQMNPNGTFEYSPMVVADVRAQSLQFDIFPNPSANGELNIRTVSQTEGNALLEIYDWAGYKVYRETIALVEGTMIYPVSLSTFPKGAYSARLEMPDGQVYFKKILLQ